MDILVVSLVALFASALTLFSGFGLGTLLMPVVAIFFSVEVAIGITAIVHLANNLFKVVLLGKHASVPVAVRFGIPAVFFAFFGAAILGWLAVTPSIASYELFGSVRQITPLKLIVGVLILIFVILEFSPRFSALSIDKKYLPFGGAMSGFFGGLSGHQGAFRSMFLLKAGLTKEQFVATGVVLAVLVDLARLSIYGRDISATVSTVDWALVGSACLAAFAGAYFGAKLVKKITIRSIQLMVSAMLLVISLGMIAGIL